MMQERLFRPISKTKKRMPDSTPWENQNHTLPSSTPGVDLFVSEFWKKNTEDYLKLDRPLTGMLIIHGLGEHGARYHHFLKHLYEEVDVFVMVDLQGHGRSGGIRGHISEFSRHSRDVRDVFYWMQKKWMKKDEKAHFHLFGHSMGGLVCTKTIIDFPKLPIRSLVLSAPAYDIEENIPFYKKIIAHSLFRCLGRSADSKKF